MIGGGGSDMTVHNLIQTETTCKNYGAMFKKYIIHSLNSALISPVFVMGVFLAHFKIIMEALINYFLRNSSNTNETLI